MLAFKKFRRRSTAELLKMELEESEDIVARRQAALDQMWQFERSGTKYRVKGVAEQFSVSAPYLSNAKKRGTKIANYGGGRPPYLPSAYEDLLADFIMRMSETGLAMTHKEMGETAHSLRLGLYEESALPSRAWLTHCFLPRYPAIQQIHGREIEPSRLITADLPATVYSYERLRDGINDRKIKVKNLYCADETSWIWCLTPKRKVSSACASSQFTYLGSVVLRKGRNSSL